MIEACLMMILCLLTFVLIHLSNLRKEIDEISFNLFVIKILLRERDAEEGDKE